mgnify:FL=1
MKNYSSIYDKIENDYSKLSKEELEKLKLEKQGQFYKSTHIDSSSEETNEGYNSLVGDVDDRINRSFEVKDAASKKKSLTQLAADEEFSMRSERFLEGVAKNENIFEYLRDSEYSLSSAMVRSFQAGKWTEEQKKDYTYLQSEFMNADVKGFRENFGMVKDMGGDILLDPLNILSLLFAIPSGGQSLTANAALATAAKVGVSALAKESFKQTGKLAAVTATEGATWGGLHNYFSQDINVDIGTQSQIDFGEVGLSTALGAGLGGALGSGIGTVANAAKGRFYLNFAAKEFKHANESTVDLLNPTQGKLFEDDKEIFVGPQLRKQAKELHEIDEALDDQFTGPLQPLGAEEGGTFFSEEFIDKANKGKNKIQSKLSRASYFLLGKSTSEFVELVDDNPLIGDFLRKLRTDYDVGFMKAGKEGVIKNKTVNGPEAETEFSFGEVLGQTFGKYQFGMMKALNPLRRFGYFGRLSQERSESLTTLFRDKRLYSKKETNELTGKITYKSNIESFLNKDGTYTTKVNGIDTQIKLNSEAIESFKEIRALLDEGFDEASALGLFQKDTINKRGFLPRLYKYDVLDKNRDEFEEKLIASGHADPVNTKNNYKFEVEYLENGVKKVRLEEGSIHKEVGLDENVFGKDFLDDAGGDMVKARKTKARAIVQDMLDQRFTPFELRNKGRSNAAGFMQARRFQNIKDNDIAKFLESDVEAILGGYFTNLSQSMARKKMFGATLSEWEQGTLTPILDNMRALTNKNGSKKHTYQEVEDVQKRLTRMFKRATGLETFSSSSLRTNATLSTGKDILLLSQQAALLPFATLSSITEPLILLSRVSLADTPETLANIGFALGKQTQSSFRRMKQGIKRTVGQAEDKVKGQVDETGGVGNIADYDDEVWTELYQTGLALDQAVLERIEGLAGAGVEGGTAKKLQQIFFKTNFLTPWTKAVQLASFTTGKRIITQHAKKLATGKGFTGKIGESGRKKLVRELNQLGIDEKEAVAWYKKSLNKEGEFDTNLSRGINGRGGIIRDKSSKAFGNDLFYQRNVLGGANRFTKEIILNPRAAEANRPDWFGMPASQFLIQFAGYPTVFNNTILKRMVNDLSPINRKQKGGIEYNSNFHHNSAKTLGTMALMTTVAHFGNEIRSNGTNSIDRETGKRKPEGEILQSAIRRWGGFGPYDYISKFNNEQERGSGAPAALAKSLGGPAPQQLLDAVAYRKGFGEMFATSLPYYGTYDVIFGEGTKKNLRARFRGTYKEEVAPTVSFGGVSSGKKRKKDPSKVTFAKGGIVKNVPNVTDEPDEMQSRVTGQPFNSTSEAAQDVTDRELRGQMEGLNL